MFFIMLDSLFSASLNPQGVLSIPEDLLSFRKEENIMFGICINLEPLDIVSPDL